MHMIIITIEFIGVKMRIYQFDNNDPDDEKDIRLMFLIGDNDFKLGATSYVDFGKSKFYWSAEWKWLTNKTFVNTFSYKDDL